VGLVRCTALVRRRARRRLALLLRRAWGVEWMTRRWLACSCALGVSAAGLKSHPPSGLGTLLRHCLDVTLGQTRFTRKVNWVTFMFSHSSPFQPRAFSSH